MYGYLQPGWKRAHTAAPPPCEPPLAGLVLPLVHLGLVDKGTHTHCPIELSFSPGSQTSPTTRDAPNPLGGVIFEQLWDGSEKLTQYPSEPCVQSPTEMLGSFGSVYVPSHWHAGWLLNAAHLHTLYSVSHSSPLGQPSESHFCCKNGARCAGYSVNEMMHASATFLLTYRLSVVTHSHAGEQREAKLDPKITLALHAYFCRHEETTL